MSDALRNYRPASKSTYGVPFSGMHFIRWVVLLAIGTAVVWLYWATRDTFPMERLMPRDQTYHLRAEHVLTSRQRAADLTLWNVGLLPEQYQDIPVWLRSTFGLPEWVLNNLVSDVCYVSGKDLDGFSDLLVVTRMSRIGCLLERYHGFMDGIEREYAGGLNLRKLIEIDAYYAVRGRTLVFSRSRAALVDALTLRETDAVEALDDMIPVEGGDVQGRVLFDGDDPLGRYIAQSEFGLSFAPTAIQFSSRSRVRPEWVPQLNDIAPPGSGQTLAVPAQGGVVLAGDMNASLPVVWETVDAMSDGGLSDFAAHWTALVATDSATDTSSVALLEILRANLGSAFAMRWNAIDVNGIIPLPELQLYLETAGDAAVAALDNVPPLPPGEAPSDWTPYADAETAFVHCPIGWGSIIEPSLIPVDRGVLAVLHPTHLRRLLATGAVNEMTAESGHLFLRIRPEEALELLREGGGVLAASGVIPGQTPETFASSMDEAVLGTRQIREIRLTAAYEAGVVRVDLVIELDTVPTE